MSAFPGDELAGRRSLVSLLFRLERPLPPEELEGLGLEIPQSINLLEMRMRSNLATVGERWKREAMALGHAEGKAEGKAEGRSEGKAEALVCLLVARFGALAPSLRTRIQRARLETLDRWFKRAIAAPDLRSVFNSSR